MDHDEGHGVASRDVKGACLLRCPEVRAAVVVIQAVSIDSSHKPLQPDGTIAGLSWKGKTSVIGGSGVPRGPAGKPFRREDREMVLDLRYLVRS